MSPRFQKLNFSVDKMELTIILLAAPALLNLLGVIVYELIMHCGKANQAEGEKLLTKIRRRVYHSFSFPLAMGFFTPYFLATFSLSTISEPFSLCPLHMICFLSLVTGFFVSAVLATEYLFVPFQSLKGGFHLAAEGYIPVYSTYWVVMTLLLWLWIQLDYGFCLYGMLVMAGLMLLFMLLHRPYIGKVDTIGGIANILLQISFLLVIFFRNMEMLSSDDNTDRLLCFAITITLIGVFVFNVVRVIVRFFCDSIKFETTA